ncbi:hypothetical protein [Pseudooceanicola aestuarii]|uniref:hypothetical protein n=1 Tax=Pseudooceanicola aestuarii TaxID=2697319 RepID=UPI0013D37BA3|nr:hypothetical protein [Pseudooceanicola aestuarii]
MITEPRSDIIFVIGACLCILAIPSLVAAYADRRVPSVSAFVLIAGGGLIAWMVRMHPGRYDFAEVPHAFIRVAAMVLP